MTKTKKLSCPQINALRYVNARSLYAESLNNGNGNMKRTLLWLLKHGLLDWDPIYYGRVVLTDAGQKQLQRADEHRRAEKAKLGKISRPVRWSGMCPAGKHGLDFEGQLCDLCPTPESVP